MEIYGERSEIKENDFPSKELQFTEIFSGFFSFKCNLTRGFFLFPAAYSKLTDRQVEIPRGQEKGEVRVKESQVKQIQDKSIILINHN